MAVPVPFSPALVALLLAVPAVYLLGRALAGAVTTDRGLRAVLSVALALVAWLLAVHVASLVAGSLLVGLPAGTFVAASLGGVAAHRARTRATGASPPPTGRALSPWMVITALGAAAVIAPAALRYHFHDEIFITGHMSIAAQMQNGGYPPRHLTFPDLPLRYHYGFDLLVACLTALLRLSIDRAIDAAVLGLWVLTWCLLWALGERVAGRRWAGLTPFLTLFGGGLPFGCPHAGAAVGATIVAECRVGALPVSPPVVSYFFQHPWSLGIPVGVAAVLVFMERAPQRARARLAVLALLLAALSLSEVVIFAGLLPALVVAEAYDEDGLHLRRVPGMLAVAAGSFLAARALGGFFVHAEGLPALHFTLHAGFGDTWRDTLTWNLKTFGLLLPLGLVGLASLRGARLLFALVAGGSLVVVNAVRYGLSADIMKFGALAAIALAIAGSAALARLLPADAGGRWARTVAALVLLGGACVWGLLYPLYFAADLAELPAAYHTEPDVLAPDDVRAVLFLRRRARPGEMIYRGPVATHGYAQWGGLPQPPITWSTQAFGFSPERIAARERLFQRWPADAEAWQEQGFRWFVLDPTKEDAPLRKSTAAWIAAGRAREVATFGALRVVELVPR